MTFRKRLFQLAIVLLVGGTLHGQDIHFTQFNFAPLTVNPAMTGAFSGSVRLGGIYRDQWGTAYSTPSFYVDSPILKGFRDQDWIGAGLSVVQDRGRAEYIPFDNQGTTVGDIKVAGALGSAAYHFAFDKNRNTVLALGVQGGTVRRSLEDQFTFEDQILNGGQSQDNIATGKESGKNYLDISGGLTLTGKTTGQSYYRIGFSIMHINQPRAGFLTGGSAKVPMRNVGYATYHWDVNEKFVVIPSVLYQSVSAASELSVQGLVGYKIKQEDTVLKGGLGYRAGDALEVLVGVDYKDLRVGASYDLTVSDLGSPNGAFELAVAYIARIYKRPKVDPVIFCPRF